jgi:TPP-dependent pyruvate/acetoin dehydrogenase alpha subunit
MSEELHERLYASLRRIRRVEEEVARAYPSDSIRSPIHLSIGQEAVAVGACAELERGDVVFCTYRGHAAYLAKGGDLRRMLAELFGKATGCAKGKGGSMHLVDVANGVMGASAVVGTTIPHAVGYAYAVKMARRRAVVVSFFGDGATEEGVFDESLNFAALKRLPLVFVCENNGYAIHTPLLKRQPADNICERARSHCIPAERLGNDVLLIHERIGRAVRALRGGEPGPFLFECVTYRLREHVGPGEDFHLGYRDRSEAAPFVRDDHVARLALLLDPGRREAVDRQVEEEIRSAFDFARSSPFPAAEELLEDVAGE